MSSYVKAFDAICQECGKRFNINLRLSSVINLDIEGFERDEFVNGSLNRVQCPHCNTKFTYEIPMIIFSSKMKFATLVYPHPNHAGVRKNPPHLIMPPDFAFRQVRYLVEAKEKYDIISHGCSDVVIEYIKLCSFDDKDALPFDERNVVFKSKNGDEYIFEQIDYNNKVMNQYKIKFPDSAIPDYIIRKSNSLSNIIWHKTDRISLKEELQCQNIKISL